MPSLKMAVTSPAVVAHDGALYVTGGAILEDGDGIELVQKYDNKTGRWTEVAGMSNVDTHLDWTLHMVSH